MNNQLIILGLLLVIGYLLISKRRRDYGFKHIKTHNAPIRQITESFIQITETFRPLTLASNNIELSDASIDQQTLDTVQETSNPSQENVDTPQTVNLTSDSIANIFSVKVNDAEELGISEEELQQRIKEYKNKYMTVTSKPLPQNIHFNTHRNDEAIKNSVKNTALSIARRGVLYTNPTDDSIETRAAKQAASNLFEMLNDNTVGTCKSNFAPVRTSSTGNRIVV